MAHPLALFVDVRTGCRRGVFIGLRSWGMTANGSWPMLGNRRMRSFGMLALLLRESWKRAEQGHCKKC